MAARTVCDYCRAELDFGREFAGRYAAEGGDLDPVAGVGGPLRVCRACQHSVEANARALARSHAEDAADRRRSRRVLGVGCAGVAAVLLAGWLVGGPPPGPRRPQPPWGAGEPERLRATEWLPPPTTRPGGP